MTTPKNAPDVELVSAEPVVARPPAPSVAHLSEHRRLIVRRSLLATALGGLVPVPVVDEYVAARVRAGLHMKLAALRQVDLPASAAEILAEPKGGSTLRNATLTAASLIALKLTWRKMLALLTLGRGAEDMTATFQTATLFDHYCARLHVGGAIDRDRAARIRRAIHATLDDAGRSALVGVFRDGARVLGRSLLEAPRWAGTRLVALMQRWVHTRGNLDIAFDAGELDNDAEMHWLDRASAAVETSLAALGTGYLSDLVARFERTWAQASGAAHDGTRQD